MLHEQHAEDARTKQTTQEREAADEREQANLMIRVAEEARNLFKQRLAATQKARPSLFSSRCTTLYGSIIISAYPLS